MATLQFSVTLRNNKAAQYEATVGTAPKVYFRTGALPANAAAADTGTLLATMDAPSDWLTAPSGGAVTINGTWQVNASAAGTIGHFRIKDSTGTTTHLQGDVTATGGGGAMTVDNTSVANGQQITVTTFTLTEPHA